MSEAWEMRKAGWTWAEIGEMVGENPTTIRKQVMAIVNSEKYI